MQGTAIAVTMPLRSVNAALPDSNTSFGVFAAKDEDHQAVLIGTVTAKLPARHIAREAFSGIEERKWVGIDKRCIGDFQSGFGHAPS
eukprot:4106373-Amphidinium_carterae.1